MFDLQSPQLISKKKKKKSLAVFAILVLVPATLCLTSVAKIKSPTAFTGKRGWGISNPVPGYWFQRLQEVMGFTLIVRMIDIGTSAGKSTSSRVRYRHRESWLSSDVLAFFLSCLAEEAKNAHRHSEMLNNSLPIRRWIVRCLTTAWTRRTAATGVTEQVPSQ